MNSHTIDAKTFQKLFLAGANRINSRKDYINELNVFPVPDGDTGTNMSLTILAAAKEVGAVAEPTMATICKAISNGSLRGARGNSGVILSQLFRGFTKAVSKADSLGKDEITAGFTRAVETAYKAVMKPKEGTILTVAKGMADKARELSEEGCDDMELYFRQIIEYGDEVLAKTPDMLPVLKQAGVVDSGGQGLMQVLKGAYDGYLGKEITFTAEKPAASRTVTGAANDEIDTADIKFGYCTEFIIMTSRAFTHEDEKEFKAFLSSIGDSIVCVADDELVKVHVHTNDPGLAIQKALTYGQLTSMKIDNMREEHQERVIKNAEREAIKQAEEDRKEREQEDKSKWKEYGFISVSAGAGIGEIFKGLGVDYLIEGGQTMNPSTEDMLNAIRRVPARNIFILPNNSNIIMAAKQAKQLTKDKEIFVIGGGQIYEMLLPYCKYAHVTKINYDYAADTHFPNLDELENCVSGSDSVEGEMERRELAELLNSFLGTLADTERRVFLCRYWYMDSIQTIAKKFGFSQSKVTSMLHRTRGKLRTMLEKEGY